MFKKMVQYPHRYAPVLFAFILFLTVPLSTIIIFWTLRGTNSKAAAGLSSWIIPSAPVVVLKQRQVCPLLNWPNDGNIFGQDGGSTVLAGDGKSYISFGDTGLGLNNSAGMISNNVGQISNLDPSTCPSIVHKQSGGNATALMPPNPGESSVWPAGMVSVSAQPGYVYFYYSSGAFGAPLGAGLAKFQTSTWNTQNAVRVPGVFWQTSTTGVGGGPSAFENGGYVYLFFGQKLGRVADANIETMASYQYWNGSAWVNDITQAKDLWTENYINGLSVSYNAALGKYVAFYTQMYDKINGVTVPVFRNYIRVASAVTGPWSDQQFVEDCGRAYQMVASAFFPCYAGQEHPEFAKNGGNTTYYTTYYAENVPNLAGRLHLNEVTFGTAVNEWDYGVNNYSQLRLDGQSVSGLTNSGIVFYASKAPAFGLVDIHEWKDNTTGEYQYQNGSPGASFTDLGVMFYAPNSPDMGLMPTYRWDSTANPKYHIYTPINPGNGYTRGPKVFYSKVTVTISPVATGYDLLNHPEEIGALRNHVQTMQVSSHNKGDYRNIDAGSQNPGFPANPTQYYLYQDTNSNYVLFDEKGPGTINRIWMTWGDTDTVAPNAHIKFYFDGQSTPRYDIPMSQLFSGNYKPFVFPFVYNNRTSSGGYVSYLPIPFAESLKVEVTMYPYFYYNIGYEKYDPWETVSSFTGQEDTSQASAIWQHIGLDPKPTAGNVAKTGTTSVPVGSTTTLLTATGNANINSINLTIPQLVEAPNQNIGLSDDGRAFSPPTTVSFNVNIDSANGQVVLKRRLSQTVGGQSANVSVDGVGVGTWTEPATVDNTTSWRDSTFAIPSANTAGKTSIQVTITPTSTWTEYHYWVYSKVSGVQILTDELDVDDKSGDFASESSHNYTINGSSLEGVGDGTSLSSNFQYPAVSGDSTQQANSKDILTNTRIKIYFDGEATPSVDAPLGAFFGSYIGMVNTKTLWAGMDPVTKTFYNYYPMPYVQSVKVDLVNNSSNAISNLSYNINTTGTGNIFRAGTIPFHATFNSEVPTTSGKDYKILNIGGRGQVVGNVMYLQGLPTPNNYARQYLEGDERIQIDSSKTPQVQGTGTEDYFNSGYYFDKGFVNRPSYGYSSTFLDGTNLTTSSGVSRFYNTDPVDFHSQIRMSIEHGDPGAFGWENTKSTWPANYYSLAFWYGQTTSGMSQTDTLDLGDSASVSFHSYTAVGSTSLSSSTFSYEGDDDTIQVTNNGGSDASGTISFKVTTDPNNQGVVLRRTSDQSRANQQADVSVNGRYIGTWYASGMNIFHRWRDDDFIIPASVTAQASSLNITLTPASGVMWDAYKYTILNYQSIGLNTPISSPSPTTSALPCNPTGNPALGTCVLAGSPSPTPTPCLSYAPIYLATTKNWRSGGIYTISAGPGLSGGGSYTPVTTPTPTPSPTCPPSPKPTSSPAASSSATTTPTPTPTPTSAATSSASSKSSPSPTLTP